MFNKVKLGGSGTSKEGNTARRFYKNYPQSARITGVNKNLILIFCVNLHSISSGFKVNIEKFNNYKNTAKLFVKEYSWFYMPATGHKILVHAADIVSGAILPIKQLSEKAQEYRNKD